MLENLVRYEKDEAAAGEENIENKSPENWDAYVAALPDDQKTLVTKLYTDHNQKLLNTVKDTRDERDRMATELRDAAKKAEKGSELEKTLTGQADLLDKANKRADFYEEANAKGCNNPKAAFAHASAYDLFDKSGKPDWKKISEEVPQLFTVTKQASKSKASAGESTGKEPVKASGINALIREKAGIRTIETE